MKSGGGKIRKALRNLYKNAKDFVQDLLENDFIEGGNFFGTKALKKVLKDAFGPGVWKDYLTNKVEQLLRLIISRDPVCHCYLLYVKETYYTHAYFCSL